MKLVICHYHLNRGGVTRVIENHLRALDAVLGPEEHWPTAVLFGGRKEGWSDHLPEQLRRLDLRLCKVPSVEYDDQRPGNCCVPEELVDHMTSAMEDQGFGPQETVIHLHNHSLGKNAALPEAAARLSARGYALLLHIHDFAEDFRPGNFRHMARRMEPRLGAAWHGWLYPQAANIHYAVLTGRDGEVLRHAGVPTERVHLLPNPVPPIEHLPERRAARRRLAELFGLQPRDRSLLYPVRCIRRKNVGEAVLYSLLAPDHWVVAITLPPLNPKEQPIYLAWKQLAAELELRCRFDVGAPGALSFLENLAASDAILTTSVAEGFGMAFLESSMADRPLTGRDLPEITADFRQAGVQFPYLGQRLPVPANWIDPDAFADRWVAAYRATLAAYGADACQAEIDRALKQKLEGGLVDFGDLDEPLQQRVIGRVHRQPSDRDTLREQNAQLLQALHTSDCDREHLRNNRKAIAEHFSLEACGRRLLAAYRRVAAAATAADPAPLETPHRILHRFLAPERFRLLRAEKQRTP